jgi:hypothetical protein
MLTVKRTGVAVAMALLTTIPAAVAAVPTIASNGIRNGASYALPGLPNAGIAQGAVFVGFGQQLGPAQLARVSNPLTKAPWPLSRRRGSLRAATS